MEGQIANSADNPGTPKVRSTCLLASEGVDPGGFEPFALHTPERKPIPLRRPTSEFHTMVFQATNKSGLACRSKGPQSKRPGKMI